MQLLLLNVGLAILPSLLLLWYFFRWDRARREPRGLLLLTFFLGFIAVIPAALIEGLVDPFGSGYPPLFRLAFRAFIVAGLVEEGIKLFVIQRFVMNRPAFDEMMDGIIYTITASMGFAFFENLFYSFGSPGTLIIRGITAVPLHAIASGIMGFYIGLSRFGNPDAWKRGLLYAVLIHGFYDFFLFVGGYLSYLVFPLLVWAARELGKYHRRAQLADQRSGRV
jgi:RsiW-degrading membrane proteinase PrsW (M82 family)